MSYAAKIEGQFDGNDFMVIDETGQGELALLLSLMYPERQIFLCHNIGDNKEIVEGCIQGYVSNVSFITTYSIPSHYIDGMHHYIVTKESTSYKNSICPNTVYIYTK